MIHRLNTYLWWRRRDIANRKYLRRNLRIANFVANICANICDKICKSQISSQNSSQIFAIRKFCRKYLRRILRQNLRFANFIANICAQFCDKICDSHILSQIFFHQARGPNPVTEHGLHGQSMKRKRKLHCAMMVLVAEIVVTIFRFHEQI